MNALVPPPASGRARPLRRWLSFGLTPRALWLAAAGIPLLGLAFWRPGLAWAAVAWDALVLLLTLADAWRLPPAELLEVRRSFFQTAQLGLPLEVELTVVSAAEGILEVRLTDDLHPALAAEPEALAVEVFPREPAPVRWRTWPAQRGEFALGRVFLRYTGAPALAERWAVAELTTEAQQAGPGSHQAQRIRVFPAYTQAAGDQAFFLLRARQAERRRRQLRLPGGGREFESLREYQPGDELRSVSWTATARRGRVVTRQFMAERSQQVWVVLDAGRLSRTALHLRRTDAPRFSEETTGERDQAHRLALTQLDEASSTAATLAQVVSQTGDKFGLLTYGTDIQQVLPPGSGAAHLHLLLDLLSATRSVAAEGDPLLAVARLKQLQRRRGLVVWITELPDTAGHSALLTAVTSLARLHLVLLVVLQHPELLHLAAAVPNSVGEMFHTAAAIEMLERRKDMLAQAEAKGVLIVEAPAGKMATEAINQYLEVKARGQL